MYQDGDGLMRRLVGHGDIDERRCEGPMVLGLRTALWDLEAGSFAGKSASESSLGPHRQQKLDPHLHGLIIARSPVVYAISRLRQ